MSRVRLLEDGPVSAGPFSGVMGPLRQKGATGRITTCRLLTFGRFEGHMYLEVLWDQGGSLGLIEGIDAFERLPEPTRKEN